MAGGRWVIPWILSRAVGKARVSNEPVSSLWIGLLERLMITGAVMLGAPEAIAIVVAVKGIGRYPALLSAKKEAASSGEHDDTSRADAFIVGTLASIIWSAAWGGLALWAVGEVA